MKQNNKQNILITGARFFLLSLAFVLLFFPLSSVYAQSASGSCSCPSVVLSCTGTESTSASCASDGGTWQTAGAGPSQCSPTNSVAYCPCTGTGQGTCQPGLSCNSGYCAIPGAVNTSGPSTSNPVGSASNGSPAACPSGLQRDSSSGLCLPVTNPFPTTGIASSSTLAGLILTVIKFLLFFAGIVAVLFLVVGGFLYMSSGGNEEQAEKGKKTITNFALGLILIIMAYAIVTIISNTLSDGTFTVNGSSGTSITTGN